jgi:6-phosphogluconolactonase
MAETPSTPETVLYVSNAGGPDIHVLSLNRKTGDVDLIEQVAISGAEQPSPTSMPMALSPDRQCLYAALRSEPFTVATFRIDPESGRLTHLGNAPLDASMAYTTVDKTGKWLLCASYPGGEMTINPIGSQGLVAAPPVQIIKDRPKAHCVVVDAANKHVYCAVLAQDVILQFDFDAATGKVTPANPPEVKTKPGAGPRHLALHPNGKFLYLLTETTATIGTYAIDPASGTLKELHFVDMLAPGTLKEEQPSAADLHITPGGSFLFGSERRSNTLTGYRVDADKGTLSLIGHYPTETTPRGFAIDSMGKFLFAVGLASNHMTVYEIRHGVGSLDPVKQISVGKQPNWIEIVDLKPWK